MRHLHRCAELMEMIRRKEYNLLLTDLNMPGINGFELLELLRSSNVGNSQTIPVVVATASGSCDAEELLERGFAGCLFKHSPYRNCWKFPTSAPLKRHRTVNRIFRLVVLRQ